MTTPTDLSAPATSPLAVCTIISHNYLSHARTLIQSYLQHEPNAHAYVLVVDRLPEGVEFGMGARVIDPAELHFENWDAFCFQYDATELCTAVKPRLLKLLMQQYGEAQLVYLDPDILVLAPFHALKQVLATSSLVLTPHFVKPIPRDGQRPNEQDILISGAYNLGFLALNQSAETRAFLEWWDERLLTDCRIDISRGLFVDQKWIDLVPGLFDSTTILRDQSYNVAFWNLHERTLEHRDDVFYANGNPLTFYHFSGFNPAQPRVLSKHQTRTRMDEHTPLAALIDRYVELHMQNGFSTFIQKGYGYGRFNNGVRIHPVLRQIYLNMDAAQSAQFSNPFDTQAPNSFFDWVTAPADPDSVLSRFLQALRTTRFDLFTTFPDLTPQERAAFVEWAQTEGPGEIGYDPQLVRPARRSTGTPNGWGATETPATLSSDIFDGDYLPANTPDTTQLKELWERQHSIRALEKWARAMEATLLEQQAVIQMYRRRLSPLLALTRAGTARWFKERLNRKRDQSS